jgi:hypothetical protein
MQDPTRYTGEMLVTTGLLHTAVGGTLYHKQLTEIAGAGLIASVEPHRDRETAFWFLMTGAGLMTTGQLARWTHARTGTLPAALGWNLLATSAVGALLMPVSGFWLMIPQALLVLAGARMRRVSKHPERRTA